MKVLWRVVYYLVVVLLGLYIIDCICMRFVVKSYQAAEERQQNLKNDARPARASPLPVTTNPEGSSTRLALTESQVLALAKREFERSGSKVQDYRVSVARPTNGFWWVRFERNVRFAPPGSSPYVRVEDQTGRAVFMPDE